MTRGIVLLQQYNYKLYFVGILWIDIVYTVILNIFSNQSFTNKSFYFHV
jgi:hypothetical protein